MVTTTARSQDPNTLYSSFFEQVKYKHLSAILHKPSKNLIIDFIFENFHQLCRECDHLRENFATLRSKTRSISLSRPCHTTPIQPHPEATNKGHMDTAKAQQRDSIHSMVKQPQPSTKPMHKPMHTTNNKAPLRQAVAQVPPRRIKSHRHHRAGESRLHCLRLRSNGRHTTNSSGRHRVLRMTPNGIRWSRTSPLSR